LLVVVSILILMFRRSPEHTISRRRPQGRCLTNGHKAAALSFLPSLLRKKVVVVVVVVLVVVVLVVVVSFSLTWT